MDNRYTKKRTSKLWKLFKRLSPGFAKCLLCKRVLSHKTSITNLKRHLCIKHSGTAEEVLGPLHPNVESKIEVSPADLIALVRMHPCLWDKSNNSYGNAQMKSAAWNSVAGTLCPTDDQSHVVIKLSEQFNQLVNEFFLKGPSCEYYDELSFLAPSFYESSMNASIIPQMGATIKTERDENEQMENGMTEEEPFAEYVYETPSVKYSRDTHLNNTLSSCSLQITDACEHTLFLLSLVSELRRIPLVNQLSFKAELMATLEHLVNKYSG